MKLYSKPGACSLADHIALIWSGLPFEVQIVDYATMKSPEYMKMNPAGAVPVLEDEGWVLTQNAAILHYICDKAPASG
ncbi:glutathione S-transferase N-terminal domain-containing protein, partial [Stenotrophomonas sp.]